MTNLLEQAIKCDDGDRAAKIIQDALAIESDDVANYCFPKTWPLTASSAPPSSANGYRRKRGIWRDERDRSPLPAALVC
jgi:hypothetical protein